MVENGCRQCAKSVKKCNCQIESTKSAIIYSLIKIRTYEILRNLMSTRIHRNLTGSFFVRFTNAHLGRNSPGKGKPLSQGPNFHVDPIGKQSR